MVVLQVNDTILWALYQNATDKIQNISHEQVATATQLQQQSGIILISWAIIALTIGLFIGYLMYQYLKKRFGYHIGILKDNKFEWYDRWNADKTVEVNKFVYTTDKYATYGNTLLWVWHQVNPLIIFSGQIQPMDLDLTTLKRSTAIEKWVGATSYFGRILIWVIIGVVLTGIVVVFDWYIYKKPLICNLLIENKTILTNIIK